MIRSRTTSSPDESLASNLQCETALLSSTRAVSKDTASGEMRPHTKKWWRECSAEEVMGPVDSGERMMAKNGARSVGRGMVSIPGRVSYTCTYA